MMLETFPRSAEHNDADTFPDMAALAMSPVEGPTWAASIVESRDLSSQVGQEVYLSAEGSIPALDLASAGRPTITTSFTRARRELAVPQVMYLFVQAECKVRRPLKLVVSTTEGGSCQVYSRVLDISGIGGDVGAAAKDLCDTIISLYTEYSATSSERLAPDALEMLSRLRVVLG